MDLIEFIKTFTPFTRSKVQENLLHEIENEDVNKPITFNKTIRHKNTIVVPMKTLVYELPKVEPFNPDIRYTRRLPFKPYDDRCTVRKPMMRDWLRHVCKDHDVLIEWR